MLQTYILQTVSFSSTKFPKFHVLKMITQICFLIKIYFEGFQNSPYYIRKTHDKKYNVCTRVPVTSQTTNEIRQTVYICEHSWIPIRTAFNSFRNNSNDFVIRVDETTPRVSRTQALRGLLQFPSAVMLVKWLILETNFVFPVDNFE